MARFIYITDTHYGASDSGYQQQKRYNEKLHEIVQLLEKWIQEDNNIDFILHGGDMVDSATEENIKGASRLFDLSVPVYLSLGNHDLTHKGALDIWLKEAPQFFIDNSPNFSIRAENMLLHVIPTQWEDVPYYWGTYMNPHFMDKQYEKLKHLNTTKKGFTHILCTHCQLAGVPSEQTGYTEEYHPTEEFFYKEVFNIINKNLDIRCVLSGHNHMNTYVEKDDIHFVTASSLVEVPFEFKLIEVTSSELSMSTISLDSKTSFKTIYNYNKTFVQGREKDRNFKVHL